MVEPESTADHRQHPEAVGVGLSRGRRVTPGLRREEVAAAGRVSVTWYTYLEHGRPAEPSDQVIDAIAGRCVSTPSHIATFAASPGSPPPSRT